MISSECPSCALSIESRTVIFINLTHARIPYTINYTIIIIILKLVEYLFCKLAVTAKCVCSALYYQPSHLLPVISSQD